MKKVTLMAISFMMTITTFAQEDKNIPDTTRMNMKNKEIIIIHHDEEDFYIKDGDTIYGHKGRSNEAHWAGLDFGLTMLMNSGFDNNFPTHPYWNTDPAKSYTWNLNLLEHKFKIAKEYVGITTGLGFSFNSIAFNDNYVLFEDADTLTASIDSVYSYSKNKLKSAYLTVPLLLEFNTNADPDKSFYLAAGVVGGVRLASKVKRTGEFEGKDFYEKVKGKFGLNPFKLDGMVRLGYSNWGAFASYSLLPLFDTEKTVEVYPLTFGLTMNF